MNVGIGLSVSNFSSVPTVGLDLDAAIAALFSSGEEGAWYDPSDLTTLYQDTKGLTAAGVGDPVGLMLDKSKGGLSATELVINGTFDTDTDWTKGTGWTIAGGVATHAVGTTSNLVSALPVVTAGKTYQVSITVSGMTPGPGVSATIFCGLGGSGSSHSIVANGSYSVILIGGTSDQKIYIQGASTFDGSLDNVSVKELPGNHATQSTSTARPTLQTSGGLYYLDFDGVDDVLNCSAVVLEHESIMSVAAEQDAIDANGWMFFGGGVAANGPDYKSYIWSKEDTDYFYLRNSGEIAGITAPLAASLGQAPLEDLNPHVITVDRSSSYVIDAYRDGTLFWGVIDSGAQFFPVRQIGGTYLAQYYQKGRIYGLVLRDAATSAAERAALESYLATKSGVTLP